MQSTEPSADPVDLQLPSDLRDRPLPLHDELDRVGLELVRERLAIRRHDSLSFLPGNDRLQEVSHPSRRRDPGRAPRRETRHAGRDRSRPRARGSLHRMGNARNNCVPRTVPRTWPRGRSPRKSSIPPTPRSPRLPAWAGHSGNGVRHSWRTSPPTGHPTVAPKRSMGSSNSTVASPAASAISTTTGSECFSSPAASTDRPVKFRESVNGW